MTDMNSRGSAMKYVWTCSSGHYAHEGAIFCPKCGEPRLSADVAYGVAEGSPDLPPDFGRHGTGETQTVAPYLAPAAKSVARSPVPLYVVGGVLALVAIAGLLYATVTFSVPDVRGMELDRAAARLEAQHLKVGTITTAPSDEVEKGRVIAQGGQSKRVRYGTPVGLLISEGPIYRVLTLELDVYGTSFSYVEDGTCGSGLTGYWDIAEGATVTVTGDAGQVLAMATLSTDDYSGTLNCTYTAVVGDVPGDQSFYSVRVGSGRRGTMDYSRDELDLNG